MMLASWLQTVLLYVWLLGALYALHKVALIVKECTSALASLSRVTVVSAKALVEKMDEATEKIQEGLGKDFVQVLQKQLETMKSTV